MIRVPGKTVVRRFRARLGDAGAHPLDIFLAYLASRSKMFSSGWGDEDLLADVPGYVSTLEPVRPASVQWNLEQRRGTYVCRDGTFASPVDNLPRQTRTAHVRSWTADHRDTACLILAGSRDEGYTVRERVFGPLMARGLDLYFLENPFYGARRISATCSLSTVSEHVLMIIGMWSEARSLLEALRSHYSRLVIAGYSMGGHMAAMTAATCPFPIGCAAFATGASASSVYTRGMLAWSVDLDALRGTLQDRAAARDRLVRLFEPADLTNFPKPVRTDAAVIVGCSYDGYVLRSETERLHRHWPGSSLHWAPAGHFSAILTCRGFLCRCVTQAAARL